MSRWKYFNPNPRGRSTNDCAIRALCGALGCDWDTAYVLATAQGFGQKTMPSGNITWGNVLKRHGFWRAIIPNSCPDCYSAEDFAREHPRGVYVLGFENHAAAVVDGFIYDLFDSSGELPQYYWIRGGDEP